MASSTRPFPKSILPLTAAFFAKTARGTGPAAAVHLLVRVKPNASSPAESGIVAVRDRAIEVRVAAPPHDGAANDALVGLLSRVLGVRRDGVSIARGLRCRDKVVLVRFGQEDGQAKAPDGQGLATRVWRLLERADISVRKGG